MAVKINRLPSYFLHDSLHNYLHAMLSTSNFLVVLYGENSLQSLYAETFRL